MDKKKGKAEGLGAREYNTRLRADVGKGLDSWRRVLSAEQDRDVENSEVISAALEALREKRRKEGKMVPPEVAVVG